MRGVLLVVAAVLVAALMPASAQANAVRAAAPGHVKYIWFNDPTLISEGLTQNWPAHDNHLHVRYCEKVHPNSTYVC
jgi:hypothetical protein